MPQNGTVEVWPVLLEASEDQVRRYELFLAPDEKEAAHRRADSVRRKFILGRGILRVLICGYCGIRPGDVRFSLGPRGKPALDKPALAAFHDDDLRFNASHSGGAGLFGFTRGCDIGIDIEQIRPMPDMHDIASGFFCPAEASRLKLLSPDEATDGFFRCWTRKEAYIKAVGDGLYLPLDTFEVSFEPSLPARFVHIGNNPAETSVWKLHNLPLIPGLAGALAYRGELRLVRCHEIGTAGSLLDRINSD